MTSIEDEEFAREAICLGRQTDISSQRRRRNRIPDLSNYDDDHHDHGDGGDGVDDDHDDDGYDDDDDDGDDDDGMSATGNKRL